VNPLLRSTPGKIAQGTQGAGDGAEAAAVFLSTLTASGARISGSARAASGPTLPWSSLRGCKLDPELLGALLCDSGFFFNNYFNNKIKFLSTTLCSKSVRRVIMIFRERKGGA
jgi:hypothetical protein